MIDGSNSNEQIDTNSYDTVDEMEEDELLMV